MPAESLDRCDSSCTGVSMEIYLYASCTSCRSAEQVLRSSGTPYQRRDFFKKRFSIPELRALLQRAGLTAREALSTRSKAYKSLGLADRHLSDDEIIELMVEEPTLLRRPLVLGNGSTVVGYNASSIQALIEQSR